MDLRRIGWALLALVLVFVLSSYIVSPIIGALFGSVFGSSASVFTGALQFLMLAFVTGMLLGAVAWAFAPAFNGVRDGLMVACGIEVLLFLARIIVPLTVNDIVGPNIVSNYDIGWGADLAMAIGAAGAFALLTVLRRQQQEQKQAAQPIQEHHTA